MTAKADIVIVNWNAGEMLQSCVASIARHPEGVAQAVVIDNGSTDGSTNFDLPPGVEVVHAGVNLGFARGCNLGAEHGSSPYILFLNPDAQLRADGLSRALAYMDDPANAEIGICGIRLLDDDEAVCRHTCRFPSPRGYLGQSTGLANIFPSIFPTHFMVEFDHLSSRVVDQVIGAFFLVRRSLFTQLGGFDDRFFVYAEEMDFSLRAVKLGFRTMYLHDAMATHSGEGTTAQVRAKRLFYNARSRLLYAAKHFGRGGMAVAALAVLGTEPIARLGKAALRGSRKEMGDVLDGYRMLYGDLPTILRTARTMKVDHIAVLAR